MKKITVLMAAVLVATTLTAGLTVLPGSVQEAQANLCSDNTVLHFPTPQGTSGDGVSDIECKVTGGSIEIPAGSEQACSGNAVEATAGDKESDIECELGVG